MINPVTLFQLHYQSPDRITPELIEQLREQWLAKARNGQAAYDGQWLSEADIHRAADAIKDGSQLLYYYQLARFPGLQRFFGGEKGATIEAAAFEDVSLQARLGGLFAERLEEAWENNSSLALEDTVKSLAGVPDSHAPAIFQQGMAFLEEKRAVWTGLTQQLADQNPEGIQQLRGMQFLRKHIPLHLINALPAYFDAWKLHTAIDLGGMVRSLVASDKDLALGVARYAKNIDCGPDYQAKLDLVIRQLEGKSQQRKQEQIRKAGTFSTFKIVLGVLVLLFFGSLYAGYRWFDDNFGFLLSREEVEDEWLSDVVSEIEQEGSISQERLEELMNDPDAVKTQDEEKELLNITPWQERGALVENPGSGQVALGDAPMAACFPTNPPQGTRQHHLSIVGDRNFDVLVFLFNGQQYFHQVYIPAGSTYEYLSHLNDEQLVSTMIVFGKEWSAKTQSPCGTPGYFTDKVDYCGFAGYVTDPPFLNLNEGDVLVISRNRLMPSRKLEETEFFDLLERYR